MRRPSILLSFIAAAAVTCLTVAAPAAAAPAASTTHDPAQAVAGWLAQQFGDHFEYDGFPGFDGGRTADVIFALAASGTGADKIDAAIGYFQKHVAEYTQINDTSGAPGPSDGGVAKTAVAAIVAGVDPTAFGGYDLLTTLRDDQCDGPSGSSTDFSVPVCPAAGAARNIFSSISESFAILAEARGGTAPDAAAVAYFLSLQCADGGFTAQTDGTTNCASDVDATGYAVSALIALGGHDAQVADAADWLTSQRSAGGYWSSQGGPNVDSTGLAASALAAAGRDTSTSRAWLASQQVTAGPTTGKGASRGALKYQGAFDASASIKASADGMLGLAGGASLATVTAAGATPGTFVLALAAPSVRKSSVRAGQLQTVTGLGFQAGEHVSAAFASGSAALSRTSAGTHGTATLTFAVPAGTSAGTHTLVLTGETSGLSSRVDFTVAREAPTPTPTPTPPATGPQLADTGLDARTVALETGLGLGCLVLGALMTLAGRRRTT